MDNNRYEETPEKKSAGDVFAAIGRYFKTVFLGFIDSFKYNNMKLAAILTALPGLIIGFFLVAHANTVNQMTFFYTFSDYQKFTQYDVMYPGMPFDATAICIFLLMLFGILNIFTAVSMSGKKNLGSVVTATVLTGLMLLLSVYYIYAMLYYKSISSEANAIYVQTGITSSGKEIWELKYVNNPTGLATFNDNYLISMISIIVSNVFSIAGVVLGFINYDRTYEKVDR